MDGFYMAADDCQAKARRLRAGARAADDPSIRADLLVMARQYDRLARREAERLALWTGRKPSSRWRAR
jgi:hypothetical protein